MWCETFEVFFEIELEETLDGKEIEVRDWEGELFCIIEDESQLIDFMEDYGENEVIDARIYMGNWSILLGGIEAI